MHIKFAGLLFAALLVVAQIVTVSQAHAQSMNLQRVLAATDWLNSKPTPQIVRGKVVLLDFYTFGCINCKHVQPNLRALYRDKSRNDLVILSVHSPETSFERSRENLIASLKDQGVLWPVAVDNDFAIWNAYNVTAWPTQMIFDRAGNLRKTIVGEGQDGDVDSTIDGLIAERGPHS
jgi:thiol-disulfide isomerase/thioredoxin